MAFWREQSRQKWLRRKTGEERVKNKCKVQLEYCDVSREEKSHTEDDL